MACSSTSGFSRSTAAVKAVHSSCKHKHHNEMGVRGVQWGHHKRRRASGTSAPVLVRL